MTPLDDGSDRTLVPKSTVPSRAWMVTFTDLVSLMLTFFVLLFSMSHVKIGEWRNMIDALSRTLNPERVETVSTPTAQYNISTVFRSRAINLDYLTAVLEQASDQDPLLEQARISRLEDRLVVSLPGELLFEPSRAALSDRAERAIFNLGGMLRNVDNEVIVQGFTDPGPIEGAQFATNWELSMARAVSVANGLRRAGYTADLQAYGYADSRYGYLPDMPQDQRRAVARRVDLVILPSAGGTE